MSDTKYDEYMTLLKQREFVKELLKNIRLKTASDDYRFDKIKCLVRSLRSAEKAIEKLESEVKDLLNNMSGYLKIAAHLEQKENK